MQNGRRTFHLSHRQRAQDQDQKTPMQKEVRLVVHRISDLFPNQFLYSDILLLRPLYKMNRSVMFRFPTTDAKQLILMSFGLTIKTNSI